MRADDALFARFLRSALLRCNMNPFDDDCTCIEESQDGIFTDNGAFGISDRFPFRPPSRGGRIVAESLLPEDELILDADDGPFAQRSASSSFGGEAAPQPLGRPTSRGGGRGRRGSTARAGGGRPSGGEEAGPASRIDACRVETMPEELRALYPFVSRGWTDDRDAFAVIEWTKCSAKNLWAILSSQHLATGSTKSMAFVLNFVVRNQLTGHLKHFLGSDKLDAFRSHLSHPRGIQISDGLERLFLDSCSIPGVLPALCSALATYNITQNHVIRFKNGVFPEVSSVQLWTARVASIMVEPCLQEEFHAMANASTDRLAVHEPFLRINAAKQRALERITREYVNNPEFVPQSNPSIQEWCETDYDVSRVGSDHRSWIWVATKIQEIKTGMSKLMSRFNRSGEGENEVDDVVRDLDFFEHYARRDSLWMWIYLCWDRGQNIPSYNVALLPEEEQLDVGGDGEVDSRTPSSSSGDSSRKTSKKARFSPSESNDPLNVLAATITRLVRPIFVLL
jgi:hypothetical protein